MITIKDIARIANVSPSTVSKALNSRSDVSLDTQKRIMQIAEEYNFIPSAFGRNLKNKTTESIGVIFCRESKPLSGNPFYSRVLEGIEGELALNNYNLVLHLLANNTTSSPPKMIKEHQVDGVILVGTMQEEFIVELQNRDIPVVLVDPKVPQENIRQILIDNEYGAFMAIKYLIEHGHKRIGFISGDLERKSFHQRFLGYIKALKLYNIPYDESLIKAGDLEAGYEHTKDLLNLESKPSAIFATNDINAIYGYKAVKEANMRIPEDISFIGFDDIDLAKMASPPLTTIRVYKEELGSIAVRNLLNIVKNENNNTAVDTLVPIRLIERDSVYFFDK